MQSMQATYMNSFNVVAESGQASSWTQLQSTLGSLTQVLGLSSMVAAFMSHSYLFDSAKLLLLGSIIETGRRLFQWLIERFRIQYSMTAQFDEGDPAYDWIILFLTQENVWRRSREFRVSAKTSQRTWGIKTSPEIEGNADYVPTFELPQLFRWKGYWLEIRRNKATLAPSNRNMAWGQPGSSGSTLFVTLYTLDLTVMSNLVEEARARYIETSRPHVVIHTIDPQHMRGGSSWNNVKRKARRPLDSIILPNGMLQSLVHDAHEFINTEDWYLEAGIPHRRGYLLYGPPGTGKSSTIYAIAGELGFEIYSLSLSSPNVDDAFLERAVATVPKHSILLLEDIDCAFPSREDEEEDPMALMQNPMVPGPRSAFQRRSPLTLSGLLNIIDGVGSEEGKIFFATTNYIDRLDSALLRPGRIDLKIKYELATPAQAAALFARFFPAKRLAQFADDVLDPTSEKSTPEAALRALADTFAAGVPPGEFTTAELQGYLLGCKTSPRAAAGGIGAWVAAERAERAARKEREAAREQRLREKRAAALSAVGVRPAVGAIHVRGGRRGGEEGAGGASAAQGAAVEAPASEAVAAASSAESPKVNGVVKSTPPA